MHEATQSDPACPFEVVGVVTQPPKRRKRRGKEMPSPVGLVAEELDVPVLCPERAKDADFLDALEKDVRPDLCITAAYGQYPAQTVPGHAQIRYAQHTSQFAAEVARGKSRPTLARGW